VLGGTGVAIFASCAGITLSASVTDITDAEVKTKYENNSNTNAFTDAEQTLLAGLTDYHDSLRVNNYISITGTDTATVNRPHKLSNGGGAYTFTLPASGTAGDRIYISGQESLTDVVTLARTGIDTINGQIGYKMTGRDTLMLEDDGNGDWIEVWSSGAVWAFANSDNGQTVTATSETILYTDNNANSGHGNFSSSQYFMKQAGMYVITSAMDSDDSADKQMQLLRVNDSDVNNDGGGKPPSSSKAGMYACTRFFNYNDVIKFRSSHTVKRSTNTGRNWVRVSRVR